MSHIVIDAFEGDLARVELPDGRFVDLPRSWLPADARAGDHLAVEVVGDGTVSFVVDEARTRDAREAARRLLDDVAEEPPEDFRI